MSAGISPSFMRFFCFMRLFWNQIFTCVSFNCKDCAISILRARVRYLLKWNSFSSSVSCFVVKFVRPVLLLLLPPMAPPPPPLPMPPETVRPGDREQLTKFGLVPDAWPLKLKAWSADGLFAKVHQEKQRGGRVSLVYVCLCFAKVWLSTSDRSSTRFPL